MTSKRRESISEDWQELESVASVASFDGLSRSTSPAPLEANIPAIVTRTTEGPSSDRIPLPLRPRNDETEHQETSPPVAGPAAFSAQNAASSESRPSQSLQDDETAPRFQYQEATMTIFRGRKDIPLSYNGKEWNPPSAARKQKGLYRDDNASDLELGHEERRHEGNIDPPDNPRAYNKACTEVIMLLDDVAKLAHDLGGQRISTMSLIRQTCEGLSVQARELNKMLEAYAKHWMACESKVNTADIPLSPDVWELLSQLRSKLLRTAEELRGAKPEEGVILQVPDMPLQVNLALARCGEDLEDTTAFLGDFLPIMRVDFDEFRTKNMVFPPATGSSSQKTGHRPPPHPAVSRIRHELYALKDYVASLSAFLQQLNSDLSFDCGIDLAIVNSADCIVEVIIKTLTNDPSNWIDSMFSEQRGLTYAQFVALDTEILHDVSLHVKAYLDALHIVPDEDRAMYSWSMVQDYQLDLLRGGKLDEIRSLMEFVKQLLLIP